ncbi:MAG: rRNA pseudouridine synthase, partial [Kordiimonadaceae bacterium]|nr:rRNA pseudouridine synthase [Kordiimonadaceae bacterium]
MNDIENKTDDSAPKGERIAKVLARAGVASRREVERMIEDGRIRINGQLLETPATLVTSLDGIIVDGEPVEGVTQTKLWRLHKKRGTLTTHRDPEGRPTVFDKLPDHMGRVISVGRLDMNTEGLLLLTNDGELARWLELPVNSIVRKYRVRVHGRVNEKALEKLKDGITIDGVHYGAIEASLERQTGANAWISIAIREGKNREVRRVMEHMQLSVNRLIRTHYGPFSLGTLDDGTVSSVGEKQMYDVLDSYFKGAPQSVGAPEVQRDPSKWAKAKKPTKVKLGASRKRKFEVYKKGDEGAPTTHRVGGRSRDDHRKDDK